MNNAKKTRKENKKPRNLGRYFLLDGFIFRSRIILIMDKMRRPRKVNQETKEKTCKKIVNANGQMSWDGLLIEKYSNNFSNIK